MDQLGEDPKYVLDKKKDLKTRCKLMKATTTQVYEKIVVYDTAAQMWQHLKRIYECSSRLNVSNLLQQYFAYEKSPGDDIATHISKVEQLALKLKGAGQPQTNEAIMAKLLTSLPSDFKMFKKAFETLDDSAQTKDELIARLLNEEVEILNDRAKEVRIEAHVTEERRRKNATRRPDAKRDKRKEIEGKKKGSTCHKCKWLSVSYHWSNSSNGFLVHPTASELTGPSQFCYDSDVRGKISVDDKSAMRFFIIKLSLVTV